MDEEEAGRGSAASASTDGLRTVLLGKDAQELRVVQAIAEMQLKDFPAALQTWRRLAAFTCHHCGAFDEAMAVYATQVERRTWRWSTPGGAVCVGDEDRGRKLC